MDFSDIWYLELLLKSAEKFYIRLKSDKNIGHFTRRSKYVCLVDSSKKVKFTLEQAMKAQRGSRGIALLFL
jgi:hypothetical protein